MSGAYPIRLQLWPLAERQIPAPLPVSGPEPGRAGADRKSAMKALLHPRSCRRPGACPGGHPGSGYGPGQCPGGRLYDSGERARGERVQCSLTSGNRPAQHWQTDYGEADAAVWIAIWHAGRAVAWGWFHLAARPRGCRTLRSPPGRKSPVAMSMRPKMASAGTGKAP